MMRILHVYKDFYPPVPGGVERYIHDLCRYLRSRGHDARVLITACGIAQGGSEEDRDGIPVKTVRSLGRILSNPVLTGLAGGLRSYSGFDLIHFHHPLPAAVFAWARARMRIPYVVTYHSDIIRQAFLVPLISPLLWRFFRGASAVLATSPVYAETSPFLSRLENLRILPPGVDPASFSPGPSLERGYFLFVGRFRAYKGLRVLLEAWRELPDLKLILVGGGPMESEARREVGRRSLNVEFAGEVPDDRLLDLYRGARAFILPSIARSEAYGLTQLEAMACGTPVISTRLPSGVPWVNREGETGLLVPPGDAAALARAARYLCDDALRARLSLGALDRARGLNASSHFAEVEKLYAEITFV
jgi:glycosyltransferase involved in cell wall biosynthesis